MPQVVHNARSSTGRCGTVITAGEPARAPRRTPPSFTDHNPERVVTRYRLWTRDSDVDGDLVTDP
jgi:hypothetical protein